MKFWWSHSYSNLLYSFLITPSQTINQDWYYDLSLAPASFWTHVRADGGDIRVFKSDGITQVPREVSGFNQAGNTGALYIGDASGVAAFYVCYGNPALTEPAANSTYGKNSVWEPAAVLVEHLEDATDSTAAAHANTSPSPPPFAAAKIRNGASYDGAGNYLLIADTADLRPAGFSLCLWFNPNGNQPLDTHFVRLIAKNYQDLLAAPFVSFGLVFNAAGNQLCGLHSDMGGDPALSTACSAFNANAWNWVVLTFAQPTMQIFMGGAFVAQNVGLGAISYSTGGLIEGKSFPGSVAGRFNGLQDEVRLYSRTLSNPEIAAMYANQNAPAAFWTTGIETRAVCQYAL